jgi:hypothetical protein
MTKFHRGNPEGNFDKASAIAKITEHTEFFLCAPLCLLRLFSVK